MTEEVKTMKYLLIRADDLGYSEGVNYGIAAVSYTHLTLPTILRV